ncbi:MAG: hypothetical protein RIQ88_692 [Actinomycetota bacterium]
MNKVVKQHNSAAHQQADGKPVGAFDQVFASRTLSLGMFSMLQSKNQSNTAFGSWRVAGGDDNSGLQTSSAEVILMDLAGVESAGSGSRPCCEILSFGLNREGVSGYELHGAEPTNFDSVEGVMDFDSLFGVYDLGAGYENPQQCTDGQGVCQAHPTLLVETSNEERNCCTATYQHNDGNVNPVTSGTKNVVVGHKPQTIAVKQDKSQDLHTQKGI